MDYPSISIDHPKISLSFPRIFFEFLSIFTGLSMDIDIGNVLIMPFSGWQGFCAVMIPNTPYAPTHHTCDVYEQQTCSYHIGHRCSKSIV